MKKSTCIIFLCLFASLGAICQDIDRNKLDTYFDAIETNNKFMGSVAISKNGKLIYTKSVGYRDVEAQKEANENTTYRIGSISKTFTATLILKAVEENKLHLDQTIDRYFPTIKMILIKVMEANVS